ncbi:hypothetical protein PIB30_079471 [Stylosanthes scabra]|uniref:Uncharacterized protein n=1 Tax=Stylosanthes scabra TaxID=79078 RepID=A0ABU6QTK5_9FABA|nr:hypothetical protein [Stylosanthes scabra]
MGTLTIQTQFGASCTTGEFFLVTRDLLEFCCKTEVPRCCVCLGHSDRVYFLALCSQQTTATNPDIFSIEKKPLFLLPRENNPSPVLDIFKLGCISVTHSKLNLDRDPDKAAHITHNQRKKPKVSSPQRTILAADTRSQEHLPPLPKSNIETDRVILSNPAIIQKFALATMASSQASTNSTKADYTPLSHETNPVLISSSCPVTIPTTAATSSSLAVHQPDLTITSSLREPFRETRVEDEGPFMFPTPEAGDLAFVDDEFNLDSILLEA